MNDSVLDDLVAVLPPLLQALEALGFIARHFHPPDFAAVLDAVDAPDVALRAERHRLANLPDTLASVRAQLETASDAALSAFDSLRAIGDSDDGMRAAFRAFRNIPRALEALYPLAAELPVISEFFLPPAAREDSQILVALANAPRHSDTGVFHASNDYGTRGGFSLYVPETYAPERAWPLVMALHGGSGHGRAFLWSWLTDARAQGAIMVAPTATGNTWALTGNDTDSPNFARILDFVRGKWNVDPARLLLTGMSDGGTFCYASGLETVSAFTHLAPVSAAFHPLLAEMADPARIKDLPVYITHGALDWMFPVHIARQARETLKVSGAQITYREIDDLSHCYPREINADLLKWLQSA